MDTIILAIKPRHAQNIYDGNKTVEFRKAVPLRLQPEYKYGGRPVKALLYESSPVSKITGECILEYRMSSPCGSFPKWVLEAGCITEEEMHKYFNHRPGYALSVNAVRKYELPLSIKRPPQNFMYLDPDEDIN